MPDDQKGKPTLEDFEVTKVFKDRIHERHAFTLKIQGDDFKGHYHEDKIHWLHPHPKQTFEGDKISIIERAIHRMMGKHGVNSGIQEIEIKPAFEDRIHERQQFTLQIHGDEYKGFIHEGEIQWFHPQPHQKLSESHLEAIESDIHEKAAEHHKEDADPKGR